MKRRKTFIIILLAVCAAALSGRALYSYQFKDAGEVDIEDTTYDKERGERSVERMRFRVAEDRKLEHHGSFIEPEGLDKYFGRKMEKVYELLNGISTRLSDIEKRLTELESSNKTMADEVRFIKNRMTRQVEQQEENE